MVEDVKLSEMTEEQRVLVKGWDPEAMKEIVETEGHQSEAMMAARIEAFEEALHCEIWPLPRIEISEIL